MSLALAFIHDEDDELEDVQVDDDMSDVRSFCCLVCFRCDDVLTYSAMFCQRMSVTSQRSRIAEDLEDDLSDVDSVSSRMRAGSELGKEEVDDFAEEEDEEGMGRVREADEEEDEEDEEEEEEAAAEEEEDDEGSDSDAENGALSPYSLT